MSNNSAATTTEKDIPYWIAFNRISQIGPQRLSILRTHFPTLHEAWQASVSELHESGLPASVVNTIVTERSSIDPDSEYEQTRKHDISVITLDHPDYPVPLKEIHNPPPLLYYRGTLRDPRDAHAIAIVGTRKTTPYGRRVTEDMTRELTQHGCSIVSGLALGIDGYAHRTCLASHGRTIAVLAQGLDSIYPTSHTQLAQDIIDHGGLLLSEFALGTKSLRGNFPQRNRIISGLARGTLVTEAAQKSGSLITAYNALEQNRDVFAVPGPIYSPVSQGPHALIAQGATLVTSAQDIITSLDIEHASEIQVHRERIPDTPEQEALYALLSDTPLHIDDLIQQAHLDAPNTHSILVTMELKGFTKEVGGGHYIRL